MLNKITVENVLTFPVNRPAVVPSPRSVLSRDRRMPFDTWNLSETLGNVFGNSRSMFDSSQTPYQGILHSTNPSATSAITVQVGTGRLFARSEERIGSNTNADECKKAVNYEFILTSGNFT